MANAADLSRCNATTHDALQAMLERLPDPEAFDDGLLARATEFARRDRSLSLRFGELCVWGRVMVLRLEPEDGAAFARFADERSRLSREYRAEHNIGAGEGYTPHLLLGYFLDSEGANRSLRLLPEWNAALSRWVGDEALAFRTASLYGFTDMATFFRRS